MTLRQVWVRIKALPGDSVFHEALREERDKAEAAERRHDLDDALTRYRKG